MKRLLILFTFLISIYSFSQDYHTVDVISINKNNYEVKAEINPSTFKIQIINNDGQNAQSSINFIYDVDSNIVNNAIITLIDELDDLPDDYVTSADEGLKLNAILNKIKTKKNALRSTTEIIDGEPAQYSGAIKLNPVVKITHKPKLTKEQQRQIKLLQAKKEAEQDITKSNEIEQQIAKLKVSSKSEEKYFHINKSYISFFNNKASTIVLEGKVSDSHDSLKVGDVDIISVNNTFSVPIRYFNSGESTNSVKIGDKVYSYNYNDVFSYNSDQHFNYSIANDELVLTKDTLVRRVQQRRFFDFFTAVLYTDVMAFDNNNSNSLVNAQAKLLVPINQRNGSYFPKWTLARQVVTEINIALYNGSNDDFRTIETNTNIENGVSTITKFDHFELLTKNNINGNLALDVLSHEAKGFFSYISLGYNASYYRTAFKSSTINSSDSDGTEVIDESSSLTSFSHGPYLNVEIRPQTNFGADIGVVFNYLTYNGPDIVAGININDAMTNTDVNHFGFKYNVVHLKADFYWLTNPEKGKKGGIFARVGGMYHVDSSEIYPQLMVGYATNLTAFVNKFNPKEKETP